MDPNERRKNDGRKSSKGQSNSQKRKDVSESNQSFQGMVRGVASGTSITSTNQPHQAHGETSKAPKSLSTIHQGDEKSAVQKLNLQLNQIEYLEQYKKYIYAKTKMDKDVVRYPAVKFEMGRFKPVFGTGVFPFMEQYVDTDAKDRRTMDHDYCHAKTDFNMHHFSFKPRRNSESNLSYSFPKTATIPSKTSLHTSPSRASQNSKIRVSGSHLNVNREDVGLRTQKHSKDDYLDGMRTSRLETERKKQNEEKTKNEEGERTKRAVGIDDDQFDEEGNNKKRANFDKKLTKQYSNYSIRCINLEMMALQNKNGDDDYNYDFRDLTKEKGASLSYEDILNIDLRAAKMARDNDIATTPEITWREYKMMSTILKMASFENRGLAQILATDERAKHRWQRMMELFNVHGKDYLDDKKRKLFTEDGIVLGKSISETSMFSASKMSVQDYAARLSGEMSDSSGGGYDNTINQIQNSKSQINLHHREVIVARTTFAPSVVADAASRSDISLHTIRSEDRSLYSLRPEKSLHSASSGTALQPTTSEASLRSTGSAPYYGLREKYDPTNKAQVYNAIHREKNIDGERTCYPEGTDESWEWRKQKHQEMLRKRESDRRRAEFLERRQKMFLSMTPEQIARLMCMMGGAILPGMEGLLEEEEEFVYDDCVWNCQDSDDAVYDNYCEKPDKIGIPGLDYLVEAEDEWKVDTYIKEGKEGVGTYLTQDRHKAIGKGKRFKVEQPVEISDWNLKLDLKLEQRDKDEIAFVAKNDITRDRPPNPPWRNGPEKVINDFDDSNLDEDLRKILKKPEISLPFVRLEVKKGKKGKAEAKTKGASAKKVKLPPAPLQPPPCEWEYDNQEEDELNGGEKGPLRVPGNEEHNKQMKEMEQKIRLYERKQQDKKAKQPWLEGPVGFSKQVCRFGLPMEMRKLEGMTPGEYLSKYCYLSARRARCYLAAFEKIIAERKTPKRGNVNNPPAGATTSAASLKPDQSATSTNATKSVEAIPANLAVLTQAELQKTISREEITVGILDVHQGYVKVEQCDELLQMLKLNEADIRVESRLFMAICALTERLYFNKFAHVGDLRLVSGKEAAEKLIIEVADFENLKFKVDGIRMSKEIEELFEVLQASDVV